MKKLASPLINLACAILGLAAAIYSVAKGGASALRFYTLDSNILGVIACFIIAFFGFFGKKTPEWARRLKYYAACTVALTLIVATFILSPMFGLPRGFAIMFSGNSFFQHLLCPVLCIVTLAFFDPKPDPERPLYFRALIPTALYAAVTVPLNYFGLLDGPYPFLRVRHQPLHMSFVWAVLIIGIALLISWSLWKLTQRKKG